MTSKYKVFRNYALTGQKLINQPFLKKLEKEFIKNKPEDNSPIFIIGPPRTGSTLLYQVLISAFKLAYITNFSSFFYKAPALATWLSNPVYSRYKSNEFESSFGFIPGLWSPSEGGKLMRYWLENREISPAFIRKTSGGISQIMGGPFIIKNLLNSLRIEKINSVFNEPIFLYIKRDPVYTCQSNLVMRKKLFGTYKKWWSVKPPDFEKLKNLGPFKQVAGQVRGIENFIEKNIESGKVENIIQINYEDFCVNTQKTMDDIKALILENNIKLKQRDYDLKSLNLKPSREKKLDGREWKLLKETVDHVWNS